MIARKTVEDHNLEVRAKALDDALGDGRITPRSAAKQLLDAFFEAKEK